MLKTRRRFLLGEGDGVLAIKRGGRGTDHSLRVFMYTLRAHIFCSVHKIYFLHFILKTFTVKQVYFFILQYSYFLRFLGLLS